MLLGVCDQPSDVELVVGVLGGGDVSAVVDDLVLLVGAFTAFAAADVRVARLVGEGFVGASSVVVLFRVVTIFACFFFTRIALCQVMCCSLNQSLLSITHSHEGGRMRSLCNHCFDHGS